jgi:hypothetical protein
MSRSEKLILIKDLHGAIVDALDGLFEAQGFERAALQTISEDFSPLLQEGGEPLAFVLSPPRDEWVACWTSLDPDAEAQIARALAAGLEQPVVYALFGGEQGVNVYQYYENGNLYEESLPQMPDDTRLDETALLDKLAGHGVDVALVDDRLAGFGSEHLVIGYTRK